MGFMTNKRILITGVASNRSIAWGVAQAMRREGAELAFTFQGDKLQGRVTDLAASCDSNIVLPLDVSSDEQITACFDALGGHWDGLDGIVHSIAFAPKEELEGNYVDVLTREGSRKAHDISSYSFAALARPAGS
jgi:enoyl-[acyl-carrier protein] reductase I